MDITTQTTLCKSQHISEYFFHWMKQLSTFLVQARFKLQGKLESKLHNITGLNICQHHLKTPILNSDFKFSANDFRVGINMATSTTQNVRNVRLVALHTLSECLSTHSHPCLNTFGCTWVSHQSILFCLSWEKGWFHLQCDLEAIS